MALDFNSTNSVRLVSRNNGDIRKAVAELRAEALVGVGPPGKRRPGALGLTVVKPLTVAVVSRTRVGPVKSTTRYVCDRTGASHATRAACEKSCRVKPKPKPPRDRSLRDALSGPIRQVGAEFSCTEKVTVTVKYKVARDYTVRVLVYRLLWMVLVDNMPATGRQVKDWNETIAEHEARHVEEIRKAAERMLPDEMTYEASAEGESREEAEDDAEKDVLKEIAVDNRRIERLFKDRMERDRDKSHTDQHEIPLPRFAR